MDKIKDKDSKLRLMGFGHASIAISIPVRASCKKPLT